MKPAVQPGVGCSELHSSGNRALPGDRALARNTGLNLLGQVLPFAIGLFTIPFVVQKLGVDRFGVLSIAWALLGYFSLFDLGLSVATTKIAAEYFARGDQESLPRLAWTSIVVQFGIGLVGGMVFAALTPWLVLHSLDLSGSTATEATLAFYILSAALPFVLASNTYRGLLEAAQRFDVVNYVKVPATALLFLAPALAVIAKPNLAMVVGLIVASILLSALVYAACSIALFPGLNRLEYDGRLVRKLASFGGWVTISNIVGPLLTYTDRFFIGAQLSVAHTSYYSVPSEAASRLWVFPRSLTSTLFPAFSSFGGLGADRRVAELYVRSVKLLGFALAFVIAPLIVFAGLILRVWMGTDFAVQSAPVLQIVAVGVLINSVSWVPYNLLRAVGRPDLPAKYHLIELPTYAAALWTLVQYFGLPGAAIAWTLRHLFEAVLVFRGCSKSGSVRLGRLDVRELFRSGLVVVVFLAAACAMLLIRDLIAQAVLTGALMIVFGFLVWNALLNQNDRDFVLATVPGLRRSPRTAVPVVAE